MKIQTGIAPVWDSFGEPLRDLDGKPIRSLFDRLLEGGIEIPDTILSDWKNRVAIPLRLLVSGSPGSGKTTLALELAYRLAQSGLRDGTAENDLSQGFHILYISSESPGALLIENKVAKFGWDKEVFVNYPSIPQGTLTAPDRDTKGKVIVVGTDSEDLRKCRNAKAIFEFIEKGWNRLLSKKAAEGEHLFPGVVIIDSLNVLPDQAAIEQAFTKLTSDLGPYRGPFLLVLVSDTFPESKGHPAQEYIVDMEIQLEHEEVNDPRVGKYLLRWLRIYKARWQEHGWGRHQVKIISEVKPGSPNYPPHLREQGGRPPSDRKGESVGTPPYRKREGGIHINQSVHRHLWEGVLRQPGGQPLEPDPSPLAALDRVTGGGFPKHHATALVGVRGGMKSHLAYLWLLLGASGASRNPAEGEREPVRYESGRSLLVTLRDDAEEARARINEIRGNECHRFNGLEELDRLEQDHRFRIVHFRPGYITPDEFLFRLWFHIRDFRPTRAVINGLDHLESSFPLCSIEPIFISSMVDLFTESAGVTTIFIGVTGEGQTLTQNALLPSSALVLSFRREATPVSGTVNAGRILVEVVRVPSARPSGGSGTLSLNPDGTLEFSVS